VAHPAGVVCVAADRAGRIYIADYRSFRVLIRDERVLTRPISRVSSAAAQARLADLHARPSRVTDRVAVGQQLITFLYGARTDSNAWYRDWLQLAQRDLPLPEVMGGELSDLMSYTGFAPNQNALNELIRHGRAMYRHFKAAFPTRPPVSSAGISTVPPLEPLP
jgi:hypothetical protein